MAEPYDLSGIENTTNLFGIFDSVNTASGNWLGSVVLVVIFVVLLMNLLSKNEPPESFFAASVVSLVVSLGFFAIGLIGVYSFVAVTLLVATSGVALYKSRG